MSTTRTSAGLLPFRVRDGRLEVLIAHMGGPFWAHRDAGAWSIVKGEHDEHEDAYAAARREFVEETGAPAPEGEALALGEVRQAGGKRVTAWAIESDPRRFSAEQRDVHDRMAARLGPVGGVPGDRPRRVGRLRDGAAQARQSSDRLHRCVGAPARRAP